MSKIIIHNNSSVDDGVAHHLVGLTMNKYELVSGVVKYPKRTDFTIYSVSVHAKPTRGSTHTFEVRDL